MRLIKSFFLLAAISVLMAMAARAQTFGSGSTVVGNSNVFMQYPTGTLYSNTPYLTFPPRLLIISGIYTNENVGGYYAFQVPPSWQLAPGYTNVYIVSTFTNNGVPLVTTNLGTWTTNFPGMSVPVGLPAAMGLSIGNFTNQAVSTP